MRSLILIGHLDNVITHVPVIVETRLDKLELDTFARVDIGIQDIDGQITDARTDIKNQIGGLRRDLTGGVLPSILTTLDSRMASIQKDANGQLTVANKTLADTAKPAASVARQIDKALPDFFDCQVNEDGVGNKNCLYIRYGDLSSSLDRTLSAVAKAAPDMVANADKIAVSSAGVADSANATGKEVAKAAQRFNQPQTFWQSFRTWTLTIARIVSYF